ncbi:MAG: hypothetical protein ABL921_10765 [Pirellula sp.]
MKVVFKLVVLLAIVASLSVGATAQIKKGKTRPMATKQLMAGLVKPQSTAIADGIKAAPADDKAWTELAIKVALMNEVGYLLMDDGRCPDEVWANAAKAMREGTAAALEKIEAKDHAGVQEAMKAASASCGACHKAHKK